MKDALALEKDVYQSLLDLHNVSQNANDPQVQNLVFCNHTHSLWCLFLEIMNTRIVFWQVHAW